MQNGRIPFSLGHRQRTSAPEAAEIVMEAFTMVSPLSWWRQNEQGASVKRTHVCAQMSFPFPVHSDCFTHAAPTQTKRANSNSSS